MVAAMVAAMVASMVAAMVAATVGTHAFAGEVVGGARAVGSTHDSGQRHVPHAACRWSPVHMCIDVRKPSEHCSSGHRVEDLLRSLELRRNGYVDWCM